MPQQPFFNDEAAMAYAGLTPNILAYGDSWFNYPNNNLMNPLVNVWHGSKTILVKGANGLELREMAPGTDKTIPRYWNDFAAAVKGYKGSLQCVMLSGGGNDFAGLEDFASLLRLDCSQATSADECFDPGDPASGIERQPFRLLKQLANGYQALISHVHGVKPGLPIILHNYDYAIPNGVGFAGFKGDWLKAPMDQRKVPAFLQKDVVARLIQDFETVLVALANPLQNQDVHFIRTAGTLSAEDWANELHPTPAGFNKLVKQCFAPVLKKLVA